MVPEIVQASKPLFLPGVGLGAWGLRNDFLATLSIGLLLPLFGGFSGPRLVFRGKVKPFSLGTQLKLHQRGGDYPKALRTTLSKWFAFCRFEFYGWGSAIAPLYVKQKTRRDGKIL